MEVIKNGKVRSIKFECARCEGVFKFWKPDIKIGNFTVNGTPDNEEYTSYVTCPQCGKEYALPKETIEFFEG